MTEQKKTPANKADDAPAEDAEKARKTAAKPDERAEEAEKLRQQGLDPSVYGY